VKRHRGGLALGPSDDDAIAASAADEGPCAKRSCRAPSISGVEELEREEREEEDEEQRKEAILEEEEEELDEEKEREELTDPVMLLPIPQGAVTFDLKRPNGKVVTFNALTLADYLLATGDFKDPETRLPLSDEDLRKLDEVLSRAACGPLSSRPSGGAHTGPPPPPRRESVLAAKRNPKRFKEMRCERDGLTGLERCAGEVVVEMVSVVEDDEGDFEGGQLALACHLFPSLADLYRQLYNADAPFAAMCLEHFTSLVEGPPNRPTKDVCGLLPIVRSFFRQMQTDGPPQFGF